VPEKYIIYMYTAVGCAGVLAQVAVIYAISRADLRRYWGVLQFLVILFLTSICDMAAYFNPGGYPEWYNYYWAINNNLRHVSGFVAVLSLIYIATATHPARRLLRAATLLGTAVVIAISFAFAEGDPVTAATHSGRDLAFTTIILNVVLWSSLIRTRHKDVRLFLVSGGLGVNMAGEAIAQSLAVMEVATGLTNLLAIGSHFFCLGIWWKAFRRSVAVTAGDARTPSSGHADPSPPTAAGFVGGRPNS
jgi:hypothetical protein